MANVDDMVATRRDTIEAFVNISKRRRAVGIRQSFLQPGRGASAGAGILAWFVRRKDDLALDLYLLLLMRGRGKRYGGDHGAGQSWARSRALGRGGAAAGPPPLRPLALLG